MSKPVAKAGYHLMIHTRSNFFNSNHARWINPFFLTAIGRAEATRLAFIVSGQEFEDRRIDFADFPTVRQETPWAVLPFLNVSGYLEKT